MIWPFRRRRRNPQGGEEEQSPGGSVIYRHGGSEFAKPQFGVMGEETTEWARRRESAYHELFGHDKNVDVLHEILPLIPHIDVYQYKPGHSGRDFWTLVTGGMSDLPMTLPDGVSEEYARVELIFYCRPFLPEYARLLPNLAHFPHDNKTWLGAGHTMPNGTPPKPLFEAKSELDTLLFLPTLVHPDNTLGQRLRIKGQPVQFLWVVPITTRECELKLERGTDALLDVLDSVKHSHVFGGDRGTYV